MFIKKIILKNFRIFRGNHEFDFSNKKIIVVEGPNGHGKSTIFDAINWAISGKISRYVGSSEYQQFNYLINSDAFKHNVNEATVEIHFHSEEELKIKRTIYKNGSSKLYINGLQYGLREGQKEIARLLLSDNIKNNQDLLSSFDLLSFIESTLILSQENLEEFVRGNRPTERYSRLEQILGLTRYGQDFKEYLQGLCKKYLDECESLISSKKDLSHKIELLNAEYLPKLEQSQNYGNKPKQQILQELSTILGNLHNYYSLKSFKNTDQHTDITYKELENLKNYIGSLNGILKKIHSLKFEIEHKEIYGSDLEFNEKIINYENNLVTIKNKKAKREKGIEKALLIKEKLINIDLTNKSLDNTNKEKEEINIDISNINDRLKTIYNNLEIKNDSLNNEIISNFIGKYKQKSDLLNNLLEKNEILKNENYLSVFEHNSEWLEIECNLNKNKVNELQNEIKSIDKKIAELNKKKNDSLGLQIDTIIHEVQTHLLNSEEQKCLVCGSDFSSSNELNKAILIQLENSSILVNEFEATLNNYKVQKNKLAVELNLAKKELETNQHNLANLNTDIALLKDKIVVMRLNNSVEIEDIERVLLEIESIQNYKKDNNDKYKGFLEIRKNLDLLSNLKLKKEALIEEEKKIIEKHSTYKYLIGNPLQLQLKISKIENYINKAKLKVQDYEQQEVELNQLIQDIEWQLKQLAKIKSDLENLVDCNLVLNSIKILNFIKENISLLEKEVFNSNTLLITIENYLGDINLRDMELKIKNYEQEMNNLQSKIDQYGMVNDQLKNLITHHSNVQSTLVNEYLNGLSLSINNYFRQISPHSYFNYINLNTKGNELFILLKDQQIGPEDIEMDIETAVNASLTLSAAQSTILAMSIFLALNKSQNWSKLSLIGIDDPFQNLDDINAYSFIDVMSNLMLVEDRQILISTHDPDFAKLTVSKMNLDPDNYAYIKIQSYTREAIEIQSDNHYSHDK